MRIAHDLGFLNLLALLATGFNTKGTAPYPANCGKVVFQVSAVDTVAQARNVEIVSRILTTRRGAATKPLL